MKKFLSFIAAAAIIFALTACGGGDGGETGGGLIPSPSPVITPSPSPGQQDQQQAAEPGPGADVEPAPVHTGPPREITVISWFDAGLPLGIFDTPVPGEVADYEIARMQYDNRRAVEERYNVRFVSEMVGDHGDFHEMFLAAQLAGDSLGDIVWIAPSMIMGVVTGNDAINLGELDFPGNQLHTTRQHIRPGLVLGGDIFTVKDQSPVIQPGWFLGLNYRLFNLLGIACPIELYHAGEWTHDAMRGMMQAAMAQGYFGVSGARRDLANNLIGANGGAIADAQFNFALDSPRSMEALTFFEEIVRTPGMYFIDPYDPASIWDWDAQSTAFGSDRVLFGVSEHWHHATHWPASIGRIDFRVVPFPRSQAANAAGVRQTGVRDVDGGYIIPTGTEDPAFVLQMLQALMSWPGDDVWLLQVTEREELIEQVVWNESCIDMIFYVAANHLYDPGRATQLDIAGAIAEYLFTGEHTLAEAIEMQRAPMQARLDVFANVFGIR
jgi:ABC-type glycerol-3-phosphate transport system substrate-binding protein